MKEDTKSGPSKHKTRQKNWTSRKWEFRIKIIVASKAYSAFQLKNPDIVLKYRFGQ